MLETIYSVEEVSELLKIPCPLVRNHIREGRLKATKIGKYFRISETDLEDFIKDRSDIHINTALIKPGHPHWGEFCDYLAGEQYCNFTGVTENKVKLMCYGDHRFTRDIFAKHFPNTDVEKNIKFFERYGGECDCETLLLVENRYQEYLLEQIQKRKK